MAAVPTTSTPFVKIVTQPDQKGIRFRYTCESRCASTIPGEHSTSEIKTYPTIEINGYSGPVNIFVSCVTKDKPYRPHPHKLVGRTNCKDGICAFRTSVGPEQQNKHQVSFNFGVQCVTKNEAKKSLEEREGKSIDPFKTGFDHREQLNSIDLKAIRLCFQVFIENNGNKVALQPVVSNVVYDTKAVNDFEIKELSHCSGRISGKEKVIILCNKVVKGITVTFFDGGGWEANAVIKYTHKQAAITFFTPPYHNLEVTEPVQAFVQLRGKTVEQRGEPRPFELIPDELVDPSYLRRKRQKTISMEEETQQNQHYSNPFGAYCPQMPSTSMSYPDVISSSTYFPFDQQEPVLIDGSNELLSYAPLVPVTTNTMNVNQPPQNSSQFGINFNPSLDYSSPNIPQVASTNQNTQIGQVLCNWDQISSEYLNEILTDLESSNNTSDLHDQTQESLENANQSVPRTYWSGSRHDGDVEQLSSTFSNLSTENSPEEDSI